MAIASCKTKACIDGEFGAPLKISMGFASWQHYYTTTLTCCHRSSPSYSIGLCHLAFALWMKSNSMLPKRKCCGALTRDDSNNYQKSHFALAATRCSLYDIYIDNGLTMNTHVSKTVASCFAALRRISSIQRSVTRPVLLSRHVARAVALGLRKCNSGRHSQIPVGSSAVDPQCSSTSHRRSSQVRPCVSIASGTALAFCS